MYCKNCGNYISDTSYNCTICKSPSGSGRLFCSSCGNGPDKGMAYCTKCGKKKVKDSFFDSVKNFVAQTSNTNGCSKKTAAILGVILGFAGLHNFYLGYNTKGLIQLILFIFSFGFFSYVWSVIEVVMLLTGNIAKDAKGAILTE